MKRDSVNSPRVSNPSLAPSICLGVAAVLSCGVPFIPPLVFVAVPLAGVALVLVARGVRRATQWSKWRACNTLVALALNSFALYLALGRHHLIDWLEGH